MSTKNFAYVQKDNDQLGTDILRAVDPTVPMAHRATLHHTSRASANGSNLNQTIEVKTPIVRLVDGLAVSTDAFKATFKFSALQHVTNDDERYLAFDASMAYMTANREAICTGRKPSASVDLSVVSTVPAE